MPPLQGQENLPFLRVFMIDFYQRLSTAVLQILGHRHLLPALYPIGPHR